MTTFGEPWSEHHGIIRMVNEDVISQDMSSKFARRVVSSVNALSGLNPDAIPDLVEACKVAQIQLINCSYAFDMPIRFKDSFNNGQQLLNSALAKLQEAK